jgi:transcription antitermination factor NusG
MSDCGKCSAVSPPGQESTALAKSLTETGLTQWFALAVKPRHDKAVARTLEGKGFETLVPLYRKYHRYATRSAESKLPLFPGYVFCRFNVLMRLPILTTPGVTQILGTGNTPIPLSENEIVSLQTAINADLPLQPFPFLQVGQRVRIQEGVLAGVVGIVIRFKQSLRLVLSVTLLQRSILLQIDPYQVSVEREIQAAFEETRQYSLSRYGARPPFTD